MVLSIIVSSIISVVGILPEISFSQTANSSLNQTNQPAGSAPLGWDKIIILVGATGVLSAIGTGLFNRFNTNKQLEKQLENNMKQLQYDRGLTQLQDRLNLYVTFSFDLKRLRELIRNSRNSSLQLPMEQVNEIANDISLLIGPKFYLLGSEVVKGWLEVNKNYTNDGVIQALIDTLVREYKIINKKYKEFTGSELPDLQD